MWKLNPSTEMGGYTFTGPLLCTPAILELPSNDLFAIVFQIRQLVKKNNSVDWLQVFEHPWNKRKIYCVDACSEKDKQWLLSRGGISQQAFQERVHWTMLFSDEY